MKLVRVVKPFKLDKSLVVTLPKEAVEELKINADTRLLVFIEGKRLILMPRNREVGYDERGELAGDNSGELERG